MAAVIYSTIGEIEDARRIAHTLVDEKLVACVNIIPNIESYYRWEGKIEDDEECILIAKTVDENIDKKSECRFVNKKIQQIAVIARYKR